MDTRDGRIYSPEELDKIQQNFQQDPKTKSLLSNLIEMQKPPTKEQLDREPPRVGRNEPCPCGSGKKFKHCHFGKPGDLGATGQFPQGKLTDDDEGEVRMAVGVHRGKVVIDYGKPIQWAGMDPTQARNMAKMLCKKADAIDAAKTKISVEV